MISHYYAFLPTKKNLLFDTNSFGDAAFQFSSTFHVTICPFFFLFHRELLQQILLFGRVPLELNTFSRLLANYFSETFLQHQTQKLIIVSVACIHTRNLCFAFSRFFLKVAPNKDNGEHFTRVHSKVFEERSLSHHCAPNTFTITNKVLVIFEKRTN